MRDHEKLVGDLLARGLTIARGKGHLKVTDGESVVTVAVSPSDWRSHHNLVARLRAVGFLDAPADGGAPKRGRRPERHVRPYEGPRLAPGRIPRRPPEV